MKDWMYDEFKQVGVDYMEKENTDIYDDQMTRFRDYDNEVVRFMEISGLVNAEDLIAVDMGCGTGAFSIHASKHFRKIHAVDVSTQMLGTAQSKAEAHKITNIEFHHAGFLSFQPSEQTDVIFSKWAFHHLPDFWKQAGLLNMNKMLKTDGILYLCDVVFKFEVDFETGIDAMLDDLSKNLSAQFVNETRTHIKEEYSTFDWILRGMIERAGFSIEYADTDDILAGAYLCRKTMDLR